MRIRLLLLLALAALTVPLSSLAQGGSTAVTLPQALALAADHPELAAAGQEVQAAEAAGARPNPVLGAEVEDTRREMRTTTMQLTQPIELGGKRAVRVTAAERARDLAAGQLASRRAEIRAAVVSALFDALAAQERVRLAQAALDISKSGTLAASKRVIAGKVSPVEETKAKVAESSVQVDLVQARSELRAALHALHALHAAAGGRSPVFQRAEGGSDVLPPEPADAGLAARISAFPAVRQARLEVERAGALAQLERAKRVPDLTLSVGAKCSEELRRNQAIVAVSIPLPVFDSNRGAELEALRRQDKAHDQALPRSGPGVRQDRHRRDRDRSDAAQRRRQLRDAETARPVARSVARQEGTGQRDPAGHAEGGEQQL